ncbi:MAG: hypothetical protein WC974_08960 [Thermoplasmata archaeon]
MNDKIKELYATPIFKDSYKDFRKPLSPEDILLTPIIAYKGLSRINNEPSYWSMLYGMLIALAIVMFVCS